VTLRLDPNEVLDFAVDWDRASATAAAGTGKLATGETISVSTWTVPAGLTQTTPSPSVSGGKATIWLTGGTVGTQYKVLNHITTSQGRQYDKTLTIESVNK
jgi:hypothetical protein